MGIKTKNTWLIIFGIILYLFIFFLGKKTFFSPKVNVNSSKFTDRNVTEVNNDTMLKNSQKKKNKANDIYLMVNIVQEIDNNRIDKVISSIEQIKNDETIDEFLKDYLIYFSEYYETNKSYSESSMWQKKNIKPNDIDYLINNIDNMEDFLRKNSLDLSFAEIIPFYCIRNFEISKFKKNQEKINQICNKYIDYVHKEPLSEKTASIICLEIKSYYKGQKIFKSDDYIKNVQERIVQYQQQYFDLALDSIEYRRQTDYLKNFYSLCEDIQNKHIKDKLDRMIFNYKIPGLED